MEELSIHALREESDDKGAGAYVPAESFYPRSPRGERQLLEDIESDAVNFLSTLSARRATGCVDLGLDVSFCFLSTLSARRATEEMSSAFSKGGAFYPRSPRGERPNGGNSPYPTWRTFYPRSPRGERQPWNGQDWSGAMSFYPRSPRGERQHLAVYAGNNSELSIHALREESDLRQLHPGVPTW